MNDMKINELISNIDVFGIDNAFAGSKYPMSVTTDNVSPEYTDRIKKLATCKNGEGHDNFLNGIIVQFDLCYTIKAWTEAERYHFLDFISSQSTMHRISQMDISSNCIGYVTETTIKEVERLKSRYLETKDSEDYLRLLYNVPVGFKLTAKMTTNYRQLKTIYSQRKNHRLPEWRVFCKWIETLPYSELIVHEK